MKLALAIITVIVLVVTPPRLNAQGIVIISDSSGKSIELRGEFNQAEIQLPAVKKQPEFLGGKKAWQDFLRSNIDIRIPFANKAVPGTYKVMIRFIVGSDGKLKGIGADSNCGYGMEGEVIRCIKKSSEWIPAETASGRKVSFMLRQVVTFTVKPGDIIVSF